ncbi:MAG: two-component system chemotaxis response regulator CheY [bacterium]|jgi:two-component system chemotaxis response regulator CheY
MKTLVVDDELVSRKKMEKIMRGFGPCIAVDNGRDAISLIRQAYQEEKPFDIITLDVSMPDLDGTNTLLDIREFEKKTLNIPENEGVKVLMVSSHSDPDNVLTSIQAGCNDYIIKPFNRVAIAQSLKKIGIDIEKHLVRNS